MKRTIFAIVSLLVAGTSSAGIQAANEVLNEPGALLTISDVATSYADEDGERIISTIGTITNRSDAVVDEIIVEVRYFDADNTLVDTVTQQLYEIAIPAGGDVGFRVRTGAARPKAAYVASTARVVYAEKRLDQPQSVKDTRTVVFDILISWAPMLLLIGVWIYFMRRMNRRDSPQQKSVALLEGQAALLARQTDAMERIAAAVEQIARK